MTLLVIAIAMMAVLWYTSRFEGRDRDLTWISSRNSSQTRLWRM